MTMLTHINRNNLIALLLTLLAAAPAQAKDAQTVKMSEAALTFAAGSIRTSMPQDGIVNPITGDNQTVGNRMILGRNDIFYLKLDHADQTVPGDLFTVYRRVHKVFHPRTGTYLGYLVTMLGVVKVTELYGDIATVQTMRSYAQISPGDPVMRFVSPGPEELRTERQAEGDTRGFIVDLQSDKNMTLVGQGNLVYLDLGQDHGIRKGDRLDVFRIGSGLPPRRVGEVKVLSTEPNTATALITRSTSRILRGDQVRGSKPSMVSEHEVPIGEEPQQVNLGQPVDQTAPLHVEQIGGETRISLEDLVSHLQYDSGEAKIKPSGLPLLEQIAAYLINSLDPDVLIRVEGHADNMEIGPSLRAVFPTNWELSKARASGIVRHLVEKNGFDSARFSALGFGDSRPIDTNNTEEGRAKNRRVEIILHKSDLAHPIQESPHDPAASDAQPRVSKVEVGTITTDPAAPASTAPTLDQAVAQPAETTPTSPNAAVDMGSGAGSSEAGVAAGDAPAPSVTQPGS